MPVAFGPMCLTHDAFFDLTPFQFIQIHRGWVERDRQAAIKHARLLATISNVFRGESDRATEIGDLLPWYDEYAGNDVEPATEQRGKWDDEPLLVNVTKQLLEQRGFDADAALKDSEEWIDAEKIAHKICGVADGEEVVQLEGIIVHKANPKEWGEKPPWADEQD
jgi:hypothetical protein